VSVFTSYTVNENPFARTSLDPIAYNFLIGYGKGQVGGASNDKCREFDGSTWKSPHHERTIWFAESNSCKPSNVVQKRRPSASAAP
jgi:hypothetical protein